jgi:DNA helicase-2/ATP-dependent DNA helicase PcrA
MPLLDDLNPRQREAVEATEGPVLVLAGAGTGKTRVITYRVAHLISRGVPGSALLAVTFTNKAADEMRERVRRLLAGAGLAGEEFWMGTFHSFCARLLRQDGPRVGIRRDFVIYDEEDQLAAVKQALDEAGQEERREVARSLLDRISRAKNHGETLEELEGAAREGRAERLLASIFPAYEEILRKAGALDFDDLLLRAVALLASDAAARRKWSERFRYIQVDEYQDTNRPQYELLRLLAGERPNLCVVGDEDQSIYSWRGADIGNILRFTEDFPGARVIRLEENYRSTQSILDAAGAVVAHNEYRLGKTLRATQPGGARLRFYEGHDAKEEADFVVGEILRILREDPNGRCAVLYRTGFQSRVFEEAFRRARLRYRVVGGFSFYQRQEVKDALAYVRLVLNPADDVALARIINTPPRGIGKVTLHQVRARASRNRSSLWDALGVMTSSGEGRPPAALRAFRELIEELRAEAGSTPPAEFLARLLDRTGLLGEAEQQDRLEGSARAENLRELVNALAEAAEEEFALASLLDRAALVSDADSFDARVPASLMTLHSAKGLEFDHVFLAGLEEGLFPHSRALEEGRQLEEERRLCYVGMTRARRTLTLTRARYRRIYGRSLLERAAPSRFLAEIPPELVETVAGSLAQVTDTRRHESEVAFAGPEAAGGGERRESAAKALIGTRVRHPTFGIGTILEIEEEGDERKLTISFPGYGAKKLIERYAQLERA